jgi:hypothetical protein
VGNLYISIYFTDIKTFFNLDNLEPAPGRPAPELKVKAIKILSYIREIYTDIEVPHKKLSLYP